MARSTTSTSPPCDPDDAPGSGGRPFLDSERGLLGDCAAAQPTAPTPARERPRIEMRSTRTPPFSPGAAERPAPRQPLPPVSGPRVGSIVALRESPGAPPRPGPLAL